MFFCYCFDALYDLNVQPIWFLPNGLITWVNCIEWDSYICHTAKIQFREKRKIVEFAVKRIYIYIIDMSYPSEWPFKLFALKRWQMGQKISLLISFCVFNKSDFILCAGSRSSHPRWSVEISAQLLRLGLNIQEEAGPEEEKSVGFDC